MRTLAITQNVTLDGSIEFLDDWFDPQARGLGDMSDLQEEVQRQSAASDALPHRAADLRGPAFLLAAPRGRHDRHQRLPGRASPSTSSPPHSTEPGWENTTVLAGDPVDEVRCAEVDERLRHRADRQHHASPTRCSTAGLVDEVRLFTYPVVQGRGRRLFPEQFRLDRLRLLAARSFRSGIVLTTYALD